jgi:hypothetical protein
VAMRVARASRQPATTRELESRKKGIREDDGGDSSSSSSDSSASIGKTLSPALTRICKASEEDNLKTRGRSVSLATLAPPGKATGDTHLELTGGDSAHYERVTFASGPPVRDTPRDPPRGARFTTPGPMKTAAAKTPPAKATEDGPQGSHLRATSPPPRKFVLEKSVHKPRGASGFQGQEDFRKPGRNA